MLPGHRELVSEVLRHPLTHTHTNSHTHGGYLRGAQFCVEHTQMLTLLPNDDHYLGITAVVSLALQTVGFVVAYTLQVDILTDFAGSTNFILNALLALCAGAAQAGGGWVAPHPRALAMFLVLVLSRAELAAFLLRRVLKRGHDARFNAMRSHAPSFAVFWFLQAVWAWGVSIPVVWVAAESGAGSGGPPLGAADGVALAVALAGWLLETVADLQKDAWRSDRARAQAVCSWGVWAWSRHPNFAGEMILWWGVWALGLPAYHGAPGALVATLTSPLLTMLLLLCLSGMPTAEGVHQRRFMRTPQAAAAYAAYRDTTSPILPMPPALYGRTPRALRRWLLCEWDMYACPPEDAQQPAAVEGDKTAALMGDAAASGVQSYGAAGETRA